MFNVEYRTLDKLGRTKRTYHGGVFREEEQIDKFKEKVIKESKDKVAFDIYYLNENVFKVS